MQATFQIPGADGRPLFQYKQKRMEPGFRDSLHCGDEMKFVRLLSGSGVWRVGSRDYSVQEGDILVLSRSDVRQVLLIHEQTMHIEQVDFLPAFLAPEQELLAFFLRRPAGFENKLPSDPRLHSCMDRLVEELGQRQPFQEQAIRCLLTQLVVTAARVLEADPGLPGPGDRRGSIQKAQEYICLHFRQKLTMEGVARQVYLSPGHFSRLFRQHSGLSFQEYLAQVRVRETLALLEQKNTTILNAALECGFSSSSGFYQCFHRITGSTPRHFVRRGSGG